MTQCTYLNDLMDQTSLEPLARLKLEPHELSENHRVKFRDGYDDLDYLVFSPIDLGGNSWIYLVRHRNSPENGTLIYLDPNGDVGHQLLQTLKALGLNWDSLDWLKPGTTYSGSNMQ